MITASRLLLAVFFCVGVSAVPYVNAAQASGPFLVKVTLQNPSVPSVPSSVPINGFCIKTPEPRDFGATVTVVCRTGAQVYLSATATGMPYLPTHGGAYRYLLQISSGDQLLGTIDTYPGVGTTTAWRVVNLEDYDYLEMLVGW